MADRKRKKRKAPRSFRPRAGREDEFDAIVETSGLTLNGFLNMLVFDQDPPRQSPRPPVKQKDLSKALALGGQMLDQLKIIAEYCEATGTAPRMDEQFRGMDAFRSEVMKALRRKP